MRALITGASRGIGLAITRDLLDGGADTIYASCRTPATAVGLHELQAEVGERLRIIPLDVTDAASRRAALAMIGQETDGLEVLVNNAGINPHPDTQELAAIDEATMTATLACNVTAPLMMVKESLSLLRAGERGRVLNVSSNWGAMSYVVFGGWYAYCTSKAALNMLTKKLAADLRGDGITVFCAHPGWVSSDMGGTDAPVTPTEAATGLCWLLRTGTLDMSGQFYDWKRTPHPW